mgnify:CR=1 FL=1
MFELPAQSNSSIFIHFSLRMRNEMKRLIEFEGLRPKRMNEQQESLKELKRWLARFHFSRSVWLDEMNGLFDSLGGLWAAQRPMAPPKEENNNTIHQFQLNKTKEREWSEMKQRKSKLKLILFYEINGNLCCLFFVEWTERGTKPFSMARQAHQHNSISLLPLREMKKWSWVEWKVIGRRPSCIHSINNSIDFRERWTPARFNQMNLLISFTFIKLKDY